MATQDEQTKKLNIRQPKGKDDYPEYQQITAINMGGESGTAGAPVAISRGRYIDDPVEMRRALLGNPPAASVPAQDPTPLDDEDVVVAARADQVAPRGGQSAVRRVDDRTPDSVLGSAAAPYNLDPSAAQVASVKGTDAAEEKAEGKTGKGVQAKADEKAKK